MVDDRAQGREPRRADARRNKEALLRAAASVFVEAGVQAPIRDIAARAGVGTATIYRHFPTRADLIVGVYRHQVEVLAEAGPALLAESATGYAALARWLEAFVDFVVTKQGLASVLQSDDPCFDPLHSYFLDRLVPVCTELVEAASDELREDVRAYELMRGVGGLCASSGGPGAYDARKLVRFLVAGLRRAAPPAGDAA
ncbi:TetR family transcriptional regulator [Actinokineospora bangkokensis]|uniref:TetR family transcriptional regulator n=1 Tax=Actinokineospora bangkokensis TaxID=1193682 RepID=A0A1Q9LNM1_9PSEU|nr:TetR family transcriptional regulator [Actinokineospora bangkokensis]